VDNPVRARALFPLLLAASAAGCALFYRAPEIEFGGARVESLGREGASLEIALDVRNPNGFDFSVDQLTYRLSLADGEQAVGSTSEPVLVPAKGSAVVRIPVSLDWTRLQAGGLAMLFSRRMDYTVEGEAAFTTPRGMFRRPYRRTGTIGH
jgi:late embryogenesis abundant protein